MLIGERAANNNNNRLPRTVPRQAGFVDSARVALVGTKLQNISPSRTKGGMTFKTGQTGGQEKSCHANIYLQMHFPLFIKVLQLFWQSWILDHPLFTSSRLYSISRICRLPTNTQKHIVLHKHMQTPTRFLCYKLGALTKFCALFLNFNSIWNFDSNVSTNTRSSGQVVRHPTLCSCLQNTLDSLFSNNGYEHMHARTRTHLLILIERDKVAFSQC